MAEYRIHMGVRHFLLVAMNRLLGRDVDHKDPKFDFRGKRISSDQIEIAEQYVTETLPNYKSEISENKSSIFTSQYYNFRKIEALRNGKNVSVCDIGGLYCGPAKEFVERNPGCSVCAVDFKGIIELNADLLGDGLEAIEGYPLEVVEKFAAEGRVFDYVIFTRTATLINIEQFHEYMKAISNIARNVIFLEVCNLSSSLLVSVDLKKIDLNKPLKLYKGMYLHNYGKILEYYNFTIIDLYHLNNRSFDQEFSSDHYFVYSHGENTKAL